MRILVLFVTMRQVVKNDKHIETIYSQLKWNWNSQKFIIFNIDNHNLSNITDLQEN